MPFYISPAFQSTVLSWINHTSSPSQTYWLGLRTDTPTASDSIGAVQEIGTTYSGGYARAVFLKNQIQIATTYVEFQTVTNNAAFPHFPVLSDSPAPNSATHWFLTDQPDGSGSLLLTGPIADNCLVSLDGYITTDGGKTSTQTQFADVNGDSAEWVLTQAASAGQTALTARSKASNTTQIGDYYRLATLVPNSNTLTNDEVVEVASFKVAGAITTISLTQPLTKSHPTTDVMLDRMTTRVYPAGFQENLLFQIYGANGNIQLQTSARATPVPVSPPPPPPPPPATPARSDNFLAVLARLSGAYHRVSPAGTASSPAGLSHWRADIGNLPAWTLAASSVTTRATCAGPSLALTSRNRLLCGMVDSGKGAYAQGAYEAYSDDDGATWSQPVMSIANARYYRVRAGRDGGILRLAWIADSTGATPPTGNLWAQYQAAGDPAPSALVKLTDQAGKVIAVSDAAPDLDQVSAAGSPWRMSAMETGKTTPTEFFSWHETDAAWLRSTA